MGMGGSFRGWLDVSIIAQGGGFVKGEEKKKATEGVAMERGCFGHSSAMCLPCLQGKFHPQAKTKRYAVFVCYSLRKCENFLFYIIVFIAIK